ncbi:hypothetical protein DMUE_2830 [Dictyocoela muelleri]|nr:hypothetical protein DMUE_2830 [Dictyocoela muelleri]
MVLEQQKILLILSLMMSFIQHSIKKHSWKSWIFFAQLVIIRKKYMCKFSVYMGLIKKKKINEGYVGFCRPCKNDKTCRTDSIFEGLKSQMIKSFKAVHHFCRNNLQLDAGYDLD